MFQTLRLCVFSINPADASADEFRSAGHMKTWERRHPFRRAAPLVSPAGMPTLPGHFRLSLILVLVALASTSLQDLRAAEDSPFGIHHRIPWTTSRLIGSPDPPLPYTVEKTFTNIKWEQPIFITAEPGTDRLFVIQQGGETNKPSRILELRDDPNAAQAETFLAVSNRLVYSFTFHPGYRTNGYIYVFSNGPTPETNRMDRISRVKVERQAPYRGDPSCELRIVQ